MTALTATDWRARAACRNDPDLFFGPDDETDGEKAVREAAAKAICAACPVRLRCLVDAMATPAQHGVWGGQGEDERTRTRRMEQRHAARARREAVA